MPTKNINLTDHYDSFISAQLAAGKFQNASEVVRAALSLLEQKTAEDKAKIEALRKAISISMEEYNNGQYISCETDQDIDDYFAKRADQSTESE